MPAYQLHTKSEIHYTGFTLLCQGVNYIFLKFPYLDFILSYVKMNIDCLTAMFSTQSDHTFHKKRRYFFDEYHQEIHPLLWPLQSGLFY